MWLESIRILTGWLYSLLELYYVSSQNRTCLIIFPLSLSLSDYRSPYSPPYDSSSPLSCSSYGSPSISTETSQYSPYSNSENSVNTLHPPHLPTNTSIPYNVDNGCLIPPSVPSEFSTHSDMSSPWQESGLPNFDTIIDQNEQSQVQYPNHNQVTESEVSINIVDQYPMLMEPDMMPPPDYCYPQNYHQGSPTSMMDEQNAIYLQHMMAQHTNYGTLPPTPPPPFIPPQKIKSEHYLKTN